MDPHNSLKYYTHKDVVGYGVIFMLKIDAQREDHSKNGETIKGISQTI